MSIILLRTLTKKSIIGFGIYKDLTIQNLLDFSRHKELLEIYYFFDNIDFNDEIKKELFIIDNRIIDKKNNQLKRFESIKRKYIGMCLYDIIEYRDNMQIEIANSMKLKEYHRNKKLNKKGLYRYENYYNSKGVLKSINHK